jgi:hypothetical protein
LGKSSGILTVDIAVEIPLKWVMSNDTCLRRSDPGRTSWSALRLARLAFLVGAGCDSREIARDPAISATPATVRAQARRVGLTMRAAAGFRLPYAVLSRYESAATRRGLKRDDLLRLILINAGSDDALIDNILDDDA